MLLHPHGEDIVFFNIEVLPKNPRQGNSALAVHTTNKVFRHLKRPFVITIFNYINDYIFIHYIVFRNHLLSVLCQSR